MTSIFDLINIYFIQKITFSQYFNYNKCICYFIKNNKVFPKNTITNYIKYFYNLNKFNLHNFTNKYVEIYNKSKKIKIYPLVYSNPLWNVKTNNFVFNSFTNELEMAYKYNFKKIFYK